MPTAAERIKNLDLDVKSANLPHGVEQSLRNKLQRAHDRLADSNITAACSVLVAFIDLVCALRGDKIPVPTARRFIADARSIRRQRDCPPSDR